MNKQKPSIRFGCEVQTLADARQVRARATRDLQGPLSSASFPNIRGIEDYQGLRIHSARWDHDYDFAGKHVAIIGTGASAVQIIPELVKSGVSVTVFQRTPRWVLPRPNERGPAWQKGLFRRLGAGVPGFGWSTMLTRVLEAAGRANIRHHVKDRWLRRQLTPSYRIGCKPVLYSSDYYPALMQGNCKLITWPIATMVPKGIRTADGIEHHFDAVVLATGCSSPTCGEPPRKQNHQVAETDWVMKGTI